jgi:hypothetical protein
MVVAEFWVLYPLFFSTNSFNNSAMKFHQLSSSISRTVGGAWLEPKRQQQPWNQQHLQLQLLFVYLVLCK